MAQELKPEAQAKEPAEYPNESLSTMAVSPEIDAILQAPRESGDHFWQSEAIEGLIPQLGWEVVRGAMLDVLAAERPRADYQVAMEVFWGAVLDRREMPDDRVIALLYNRFDPRGDSEDNLVWSITSKLKGVDYLSEYNPLHDPGVKTELAAIRSG